jgi:DNA-directed RNA polymerase subunit H (RpoH/RPB5)
LEINNIHYLNMHIRTDLNTSRADILQDLRTQTSSGHLEIDPTNLSWLGAGDPVMPELDVVSGDVIAEFTGLFGEVFSSGPLAIGALILLRF